MASELSRLISAELKARGRWHPIEIGFWVLAFAAIPLFPERHLLLNEITILALFALSLDLLLGYAGIVSLGHGAFLGIGAYTAGLVAIHISADPFVGLTAAALVSTIAGFASSFLVLRGSDLTRLMVTLGVSLVLFEVANKASWLTGGADGLLGISMKPLLGRFNFDIFGHTSFVYSLIVTFVLFVIARRIVGSPFGSSLRCIRDNTLRASAIGIPVKSRLVAIYTVAACYAGIAGALLAQTTQFVNLDVLEFHRSADVLLILVIGGAGYLYGGLIGAILFKFLQDIISTFTPQYYQFWIGLILVIVVLIGRDRIHNKLRDWIESLRRCIAKARGLNTAEEPHA